MNSVEKSTESYSEEKDSNIVQEDDGVRDEAKEIIMTAGQSKRIWGELYKVMVYKFQWVSDKNNF